MEISHIEKVVMDFIATYPGMHKGSDIADALKFRIESAVINLVNKGILEVKVDWTLQLKEPK